MQRLLWIIVAFLLCLYYNPECKRYEKVKRYYGADKFYSFTNTECTWLLYTHLLFLTFQTYLKTKSRFFCILLVNLFFMMHGLGNAGVVFLLLSSCIYFALIFKNRLLNICAFIYFVFFVIMCFLCFGTLWFLLFPIFRLLQWIIFYMCYFMSSWWPSSARP